MLALDPANRRNQGAQLPVLSPERLAGDAVTVPVHVSTVARLHPTQWGSTGTTGFGAIAVTPVGDRGLRLSTRFPPARSTPLSSIDLEGLGDATIGAHQTELVPIRTVDRVPARKLSA